MTILSELSNLSVTHMLVIAKTDFVSRQWISYMYINNTVNAFKTHGKAFSFTIKVAWQNDLKYITSSTFNLFCIYGYGFLTSTIWVFLNAHLGQIAILLCLQYFASFLKGKQLQTK